MLQKFTLVAAGVYRKLKPDRIGDEVRPGWRVKL
jgi:hypothetical protein